VLIEDTRCELHLVLNSELTELTLGSFVGELKKSKKYSLLTALTVMNQEFSEPFFRKLRRIVLDNLEAKSKLTYGLPVTWSSAEVHFRELSKLLSLSFAEKMSKSSQCFEELKNDFLVVVENTPEADSKIDPLTRIAGNIAYKAAMQEFKVVERQTQMFM
jgi:hypothetical protein